jgi:hypothetical protein
VTMVIAMYIIWVIPVRVGFDWPAQVSVCCIMAFRRECWLDAGLVYQPDTRYRFSRLVTRALFCYACCAQ